MTVPGRSFVPVPTPGIATDELDGERLLWLGGRLRALDPVASIVWALFDGRATIGELSGDLATGFAASRSVVEADVARLCGDLVEVGLLVGATTPLTGQEMAPEPVPALVSSHLGPGPVPSGAHRLARVDWVYVSGRFAALAHDFGIRTNDVWLGQYVDHRFGVFAAPGVPAEQYSVVDTALPGPSRFETYLDGRGLSSAADRDLVVRHLLWHVNQEVVHRDRTHLLIHAAGAVAGNGLAIVLPGAMNAGKSTLVAGLVDSGFGYLTDELVALDVDSGWIDPYPRPMNLGRGSWKVHPALQPGDWDPEDPVPRDLWHVDARTVGELAHRTRLGYVVAPRFEQGADASLSSISRAEAAELLYHHAFNRGSRGVAGYRAIVGAVSNAQCARLVSGRLRPAVDLVRRFTNG